MNSHIAERRARETPNQSIDIAYGPQNEQNLSVREDHHRKSKVSSSHSDYYEGYSECGDEKREKPATIRFRTNQLVRFSLAEAMLSSAPGITETLRD